MLENRDRTGGRQICVGVIVIVMTVTGENKVKSCFVVFAQFLSQEGKKMLNKVTLDEREAQKHRSCKMS